MIPRRMWAFLCLCGSFLIFWCFIRFMFPNEAKNVLGGQIHKKIEAGGTSLKNRFSKHNLVKTKHNKSQTTNTRLIDSYRQRNGSRSIKLLRVKDVPQLHVTEINCAALFEGNQVEQSKAKKISTEQSKHQISSNHFVPSSQDCETYIKKRQYIMEPVSVDEFQFPIAYSILVYKDVEQFERLLRAIYRPQNLYCIHVEVKSSELFKDACSAIAGCFENVFIAPVSISVEWGFYSVLEPEFICMEELWKRSRKWKYFINLTGQEFPLKTNGDIVKILKVYGGANNMEGTILRQSPELQSYLFNPPFNITVTKGSVHITASRGFVDYVLHNKTGLEFREWIRNIPVPDELFFSSLNHNPQLNIPGAYKGIPETDTKKNLFITRFKNWGMWPFVWPCYGMWVRQICIFGVRDLPLLASRPELFANKFFIDYQPMAIDCMEERHYNLTRDEVLGRRKLDLGFYRDLDFVKNHV